MIKHAAKYFSGQFLARGTVYLYSLLLAKILSKSGFVDFTLFLISANIYSRIANYSLNMLIVKMRYTGQADAEEAQEHLYRFAVGIGLVLTLVLSLLTWITPMAALFGASKGIFQAILIAGYLQSIENNAIELYQSQFRSNRYMAYMFSFTFALAVFSGLAFFSLPRDSALTPIIAYVCSQLLVTFAYRNGRLPEWPSRKVIYQYLVIGTPLFLYALSTYTARYLEVFMVKSLDTSNSAANFAYIFRMTEALSLVNIAVSAVTNPVLFRMLGSNSASTEDRLTLKRMIGIQILIFFIFYLAIRPVTHRFFSEFDGSLLILAPLIFLNFLQLVSGLLQVYLLHYNFTKFMLVTNVVLLLSAVALNRYAIPHWGVMGSAVVKVVLAACMVGAYAWRVRKTPFSIRQTGTVGLVLASAVLLIGAMALL